MPWLLVLAAVMTLLTACQQPPASHPSVSKAASPAEQFKSEGDAFMAKADYVSAIEKYRQAADLDPTALGPRFGLGTANSFLEKRPEAVMQFRWVLARADTGSIEYQEAHRWLVRVGALPAPAASVDAGQLSQPRPADASSIGRLVGRTEWPEVTPQRRLITGTLSLVGDEPFTQDVKRSRAFRLGDVYEFKDVPSGPGGGGDWRHDGLGRKGFCRGGQGYESDARSGHEPRPGVEVRTPACVARDRGWRQDGQPAVGGRSLPLQRQRPAPDHRHREGDDQQYQRVLVATRVRVRPEPVLQVNERHRA